MPTPRFSTRQRASSVSSVVTQWSNNVGNVSASVLYYVSGPGSITATTEATATTLTSITVAMHQNYALITFGIPYVIADGTNDLHFSLFQSIGGATATSLGEVARVTAGTWTQLSSAPQYIYGGSASYEWSIRTWTDGGTGYIYADSGTSGAFAPMVMTVTGIG